MGRQTKNKFQKAGMLLFIIFLSFSSVAVFADTGEFLGTRSKIYKDLRNIGVQYPIGCGTNPKTVQRLWIEKSGVYENFRIDGEWIENNLVKIKADKVILKNSEIYNGSHNGIVVYANNVEIDSCKIHHLLKGTSQDMKDAHGISGRPNNLIIRNCEIFNVSGDSVQFDPDRGPWDNVLIENCTFWTGPLKNDMAGFKKGDTLGENAVDTKQSAKNPKSRMTIRNCIFYGWGKGKIDNMAALNLKGNVQVSIENSVFFDNDICFRLRGGKGSNGGALINIKDCALFRSEIGLRLEDEIENLKIIDLGFDPNIKTKYIKAKADSFLSAVPLGDDRMILNLLGLPWFGLDSNQYGRAIQAGPPRPLPENFKEQLKNNGMSLSNNAVGELKREGGVWTCEIIDGKTRYPVIDENGKVNIYGAQFEYLNSMKKGIGVPKALLQFLNSGQQIISENSTIMTEKKHYKWKIIDTDNSQEFILAKEGDRINIHGLKGYENKYEYSLPLMNGELEKILTAH